MSTVFPNVENFIFLLKIFDDYENSSFFLKHIRLKERYFENSFSFK